MATRMHDRYIKCLSGKKLFSKKNNVSMRARLCLTKSLILDEMRLGIVVGKI